MDDFSNDNIAALRKINRAINEETLINRKKREFSEEWEKFKINNVDDDPWKLPHKFLDIKFRLSEMFEDREREYIDSYEYNSEYRYSELLDMAHWAFEFLRRCPDYRNIHKNICQKCDENKCAFSIDSSDREKLKDMGLVSVFNPYIPAWDKSVLSCAGVWDQNHVRDFWAYSGAHNSEIPPFYPSSKIPEEIQVQRFRCYLRGHTKHSLPKVTDPRHVPFDLFSAYLKTYDAYQKYDGSKEIKRKVAEYVFPNNSDDQAHNIRRYFQAAKSYIEDKRYEELLFFIQL